MNVRTSIILVVTLAMVAGYVFFVQIGQVPEVEKKPPWFYNVDLADMTRIAIRDRGEEVVFFRDEEGDRWYLGAIDDGLPAGLDRFSGVTLLLGGPKSSRLLDPQPTDLAPYGLDIPPTSIEVDLKDGRTLRLFLGLPTPDGVGTYAQVEGDPQVFTIFGGWGDVMTGLVSEPPYPEWYYNIDLALLAEFEVRTQEKTIALMKADVGWHFKDEIQSPVDEARLPSILASLGQLSQTLVETNAEDLVQYGLDEPSLTLFLQTEESERAGESNLTVTFVEFFFLYIGNPTEDGTGYYVQAEREKLIPDVFTVNADWVEGLQAIVANPPYLSDVAQGN